MSYVICFKYEKPKLRPVVGFALFRDFYDAGSELAYHISQFAIHLRELAIRKNLKTSKIARQKICKKKKTKKYQTHLKKVGHTSEFLFGIYWWTYYLLENLLKWVNKKCKNFNIYNIVFFIKIKKPGDIILHRCTKYLDDMIYSSWDI